MALTPQPKNLRNLQWNYLSFRQRRASTQELSKDFDVVILCETWLNPSDYASLKGFVVIRNDRPAGRGGGTAICIRSSIPFKSISTYNSFNFFESNAVSIITSQGELLIVSIYKPPNLSFDNNHIHRFLTSISSFKSIFIGSSYTCNLGDYLLSSFSDHDLLLLNNGSRTYLNRRNPSNPSCLLHPIRLPPSLHHFLLVCKRGQSLQRPLPRFLFLCIHAPFSSFRSHRPNYRRITQEDSLFNFSFDNLLVDASLSDKYILLTSTILSTINPFLSPSRSSTKRPRPPEPPWLNADCSQAESARKRALKDFRRNSNLYANLLEAEDRARFVFSNAKKSSYQEACASLTPSSDPNKFWELIKRFKHRNLGSSDYIANIEKQSNLIPSICPPSCFYPNFPSVFTPSLFTLNFFCKHFTRPELDIAVNQCLAKPNSVPGLDKINNLLISHLPDNIIDQLLSIFNGFYLKGIFPPCWSNFLVFFIPKFRPISLAQSPLKIFERLILRRLT
ncbi:hypothetical protein TSAR_011350, partial [Trichomalopsis sarcophagae]